MKQEDKNKDLCKTCQHYWQDFPLPLESVVSHCGILDEKYGLSANMDEKVPYPCLKCSFDCFLEKNKVMTQPKRYNVVLVSDGKVYDQSDHDVFEDAVVDAIDLSNYQKSFRLNDYCEVRDSKTNVVLFNTERD